MPHHIRTNNNLSIPYPFHDPTLQSVQNALTNNEFLSRSQVEHYQGDISDAFQDAADTYQAEIEAVNDLMVETIKVQVSLSRYMCLSCLSGTISLSVWLGWDMAL